MFMPVILAALTPVRTTYTLGSDVSKWNGVVNWAINYAAGGRFTWARLGSISATGVLYIDYQWPRNSVLAPERMFTGGYWYFRPRHDANKQADYVCEQTEGKNLLLPLGLDCENNETGMEARYVEKRVETFINRYYENVNKYPVIYTSKGFWSYPNIYATDGRPDWAAERDLWVANYTIAANPALPATWVTKGYKFWQWSADGNYQGPTWGGEWSPGAPKPSMDINRFLGDYVALEDYIDDYNSGVITPPTPTPPPVPVPPTPEPAPSEYVETTTYVNLRTDNFVSLATLLYTMPPGTRLESLEREGDWVVVKCYVHGDYVK
jgi:GH25 family lysozyme M1 (1,4-beta-N-acetylmuramidase)